jgi:drug/metabolite transporter (DMT)-like permease
VSSPAHTGFLLALLSAVSFAAYILPRKKSKLNVWEYQFWLGFGVLLGMVGTALIGGQPLFSSPYANALGFICGPLWAMGSIAYSQAVDHIGVARSTPIKNLAPLFAAVYGILLFHEYTISEPKGLALAVSGIALMLLATWILGNASAPEHETAFAYDQNRPENERRRAFYLGGLYSFAAAFFYGLYSIPLKKALKTGADPLIVCAWMGWGVWLSSIVFWSLTHRRLLPPKPAKRELMLAGAAGLIWSSAQILGTMAMLYTPMSISWSVSNLSTLMAVGWGIWVFKEVRLDRHKWEMGISLASYTVGLVLLALAAPIGHV